MNTQKLYNIYQNHKWGQSNVSIKIKSFGH
jgi:hypothetical protein